MRQKPAQYEEFQGAKEGLAGLKISDQDLRAAVEGSLHKADSEPRVPDTEDEPRPWDASISRYFCCASDAARLRPPCCRSCGEERAWNQWADRRGIPRTYQAVPAPHTRSTR